MSQLCLICKERAIGDVHGACLTKLQQRIKDQEWAMEAGSAAHKRLAEEHVEVCKVLQSIAQHEPDPFTITHQDEHPFSDNYYEVKQMAKDMLHIMKHGREKKS